MQQIKQTEKDMKHLSTKEVSLTKTFCHRMKDIKRLVIMSFFIFSCQISSHAQVDTNAMMEQATLMGEAAAPMIVLQCVSGESITNAYLKLIQFGLVYPTYYLLSFRCEGELFTFRIPLNNFPKSLIAETDNIKFDPNTMTFYCGNTKTLFKVLGSAGNNQTPLTPNNSSLQSPQHQTSKQTCTMCYGKGWIRGSRTPTYGQSGTRWCNDCGEVPVSHSHDRCPSCNGKGYIIK